MAYKASFDGGAAAVLFTGRDAAKVPVTAGPRDIGGDFTMPAFSCVHSPASNTEKCNSTGWELSAWALQFS